MRPPLFLGVAGAKNVGKTYTSMQTIREYVRGNKYMRGRNVLIFDVNDEFTDIKSMALHHVAYFAHRNVATKQVRRIRAFKNDGNVMSIEEKQAVLDYILQHYANGLLLVEDYYNYTSDNMKRDIVGLLTSQRHKNMDVIIHSQGVGRLFNPKLMQQYSYIRLHPTVDNMARYKSRLEEHYEVFSIAEKLCKLKNAKLPLDKQYFHLFVAVQIGKIEGAFSKPDAEEAIDLYIENNKKETMQKYMNKTNQDGKKMYSYSEALNLSRKELLQQYFKY